MLIKGRMKKLLSMGLIVIVSTILWQPARAITKTGTIAAQFLKIGVGARQMGMGGAVVACAPDATAMYWNPALMTAVSGNVALVHTNWLVDTDYSYVGLVLPPATWGRIGFSASALTMGDMKVRTVEHPEGTGEYFSARDLAIGFSYARKLTNFFSIGFQGKYLQEEIWHCIASSFAIDFGTIYHSDNNRVRLGAAVSNFGTKLQFTGKDLRFNYDQNVDEHGDNEHLPALYHTDKWNLPLLFRVGVAVDFPLGKQSMLTCETDAVHPNDNTEYLNLGIEWQWLNMFYIRGGYHALFMNRGEQGVAAGVGLKYRLAGLDFQADYSYSEFGRFSFVDHLSIVIYF